MKDVLTRIMADKADEVGRAKKRVTLAALEQDIAKATPARGFIKALSAQTARKAPAIIAEMKRASPSRGVLRGDLDPALVARSYEAAGAAALSVLTDESYFRGSALDLVTARAACRLPVLRKDFMLDPYQIAESRAMGADCVLLIVAALTEARLHELYAASVAYGLDALIEIHDAQELAIALRLPGGVIGINNRDLQTFATSIDTTIDLMSGVPSGRLVVSESGIANRQDVMRLKGVGVAGFLVGEAFMVVQDPGERLIQLFEGWL